MVHEIRDDVTLISPRLRHRSQWVVRDLPGLVELGREAAELALADYPIVNPRPELVTPEPEAQDEPQRPRGVAAFFQRR